MADLVLLESGIGGDVELLTSDIAMTSGLTNMVYLALFGGNPNFVTKTATAKEEQNFDWWGNSLIFQNQQGLQYNSLTENVLNTTALDSSGRIKIENAVKKDLTFMADFADVDVSVSIISDDRVSIEVNLQEPGNLDDKVFQFIWDSTKNEVITEVKI